MGGTCYRNQNEHKNESLLFIVVMKKNAYGKRPLQEGPKRTDDKM